MASYQSGNSCFATPLLANQNTAAELQGQIVQVGTASYIVKTISVSAKNIVYQFQNVSSTAVINKTYTVSPPICGYLDTADMLSLVWKIILCWVAVYAFKLAATSIQSMYHGDLKNDA
jgi:hypothetical protein